MQQRYMAIWFRHLLTDGLARRKPELKGQAFVLVEPVKNRIVITSSSKEAEQQGAFAGMAAADARAAVPELQSIDAIPGHSTKLLRLLGIACIRYTPIVSIDLPNNLILNITGCAHLWGGEAEYYKAIHSRLSNEGFDTRMAIADTPGVAWAVAHFAQKHPIIKTGENELAISGLPPAALRIEPEVNERLKKLGFRNIEPLLQLPPQMLRRRFGPHILQRIDQVLGRAEDYWEPLIPPVPYVESLPCLEPVRTAAAIEIAIEKLLSALCLRLQTEGKGLRKAFLKCHRIDGKKVQVNITTVKGSHSVSHLSALFELQINKIEPALGIELFVIEAPVVEDMETVQEQLWIQSKGLADKELAELLDRISGKVGAGTIRRFLPSEHHWPERSVKTAVSLTEEPESKWPGHQRPIRLLSVPKPIDVMALIPDHPPKFFTYKGKQHTITKADGPERIGREWWQDKGDHRDYYVLEDTDGQRYWVFRSGHYDSKEVCWYLHGYFA